jgi:hypothetical protein
MATINYLDNNTDGIFGMVSCSTLNSTNVKGSLNYYCIIGLPMGKKISFSSISASLNA